MINLTGKAITPLQRAAGVEELPSDLREEVKSLLSFEFYPHEREINKRAEEVTKIVLLHMQRQREIYMNSPGCQTISYTALIEGPPFMCGALEKSLRKCNIEPYYPFITTKLSTGEQPMEFSTLILVRAIR